MIGDEFIPGFCLVPGCPELALEQSNFCAFHQPPPDGLDAARTYAQQAIAYYQQLRDLIEPLVGLPAEVLADPQSTRPVLEQIAHVTTELLDCTRLAQAILSAALPARLDTTPARDPAAARQLHCAAPAQVRPPIETAPGDRRLSDLGYRLVRIEKDPATGRDVRWLWQPGPTDGSEEC